MRLYLCRLLLPALLLAACQANDRTPEVEAPGGDPSAIGSAAIPVEARMDVLTPDGWGPLRIGMTRAEVVAAAGEDANPDALGGPEPEQCDEFRPEDAPRGMLLMLEQGQLTRISLINGSTLRTPEGIQLGDSAAAVVRAYGPRAERSPHKYVEAPAEYITVWTTAPPAAGARGLVFEIGLDGRVSQIRAGGPSIQYVEGCL